MTRRGAVRLLGVAVDFLEFPTIVALPVVLGGVYLVPFQFVKRSDPRHPRELLPQKRRGESCMEIVGLPYDLQTGWSSLVLRTSAGIPATFEKIRIYSLPTEGSVSSYCGRSESAAVVTTTERNPTQGGAIMAD